MNQNHPSQDSLRRYAAGLDKAGLDQSASRLVVAEHLEHCVECRRRLAGIGGLASGRSGPRVDRSSYNSAFESVRRRLGAVHQDLDDDRGRAAEMAKELLSHPAERRHLLIDNSSRFHSWALAEHLLGLARDCWTADPHGAEAVIRLALEVLARVPDDSMNRAAIADLKGRAWTYVGNVRRIRCEYRASGRAFRAARNHIEAGSGDPLEEARLLSMEASLMSAARRFDDAARNLERAARLARKVGAVREYGRLLLQKAVLFTVSGRNFEALALLEDAAEKLDVTAEPRLVLVLRQTQLSCLLEADHVLDAIEVFPLAARLAEEVGEEADRMRVRWAEAKLHQRLGRVGLAEEALREIRDYFVGIGYGFDAALASLDLATIMLEHGRTRAVKTLVGEMVPIFAANDIHREALAALLVFRQAAEQETASVELARELNAYLERSRERPELRFRRSS